MKASSACVTMVLISLSCAPALAQIQPADPSTLNPDVAPIGTLVPSTGVGVTSISWAGRPATFVAITPQMGPIAIDLFGPGLGLVVQAEALRYVGSDFQTLASGHSLVLERINAGHLRLHVASTAGSPSYSYHVRLRDAVAMAQQGTVMPPAPPPEPWGAPADPRLYEPIRQVVQTEGVDLIIPGLRLQYGDVLSATADWYVDGGQGAGADTSVMYSVPPQLGRRVAAAGDVNGDGLADLLFGAPYYDNGQTNEGRVQAHFGASAGPATAPQWYADSDTAHANFGRSIAGAGDINGDGYDDVLLMAYANIPRDMANSTYELRSYLGSANGPLASPAWSYSDTIDPAPRAHQIAYAGDLNGDGFADVVAAVQTDLGWNHNGPPGYIKRGRVLVFHGSPTGLRATPNWVMNSNEPALHVEIFTVCSAGDVDRDGYDDLIVGEARYHKEAPGRARIFRGGPGGVSWPPLWTYTGPPGTSFGFASCGIGDVNGDGYDDVAITDPGSGTAAVLVFHGGPLGPTPEPAWHFTGLETGLHQFGTSIAGALDVNGDGFADLVVGGSAATDGKDRTGRAFLFTGSPSGLSPRPVWIATGDQRDAYFGVSVAGTPDPWGGPVSAVLVGANLRTNLFEGEGRASLFRGRQTIGPGAAPSVPAAAQRLKRLPARQHLFTTRGGVFAVADVQREQNNGELLLVLPNHRRIRLPAAEVTRIEPAPQPRPTTTFAPRVAPPSVDQNLRAQPRIEVYLQSGEVVAAVDAAPMNRAGDLRLTLDDGSHRTIPANQIGFVSRLRR